MTEKFEGGTLPQESKEGESKMKYQLIYNEAAGEHETREWTDEELNNEKESGYSRQYGYFTEVGLYDSKEELEQAIEKLRGEPVFAVFEDTPAGEVTWHKEDNLSGNWRGSKHYPFSYVTEFTTEKEAEEYVRKKREDYAKLEETSEKE